MAAWWSRATYLPPPSLAWSQPKISHWPRFPLGRLLEAHTLLLLQVTLAAPRKGWSGVHVGAGGSQRPGVAATSLRPQPHPDVTTSPKTWDYDPDFNWLPCDWASVSPSAMRGTR